MLPIHYILIFASATAAKTICNYGNDTDLTSSHIRDVCEDCSLVNPYSTNFQCHCRGNIVEGDLGNYVSDANSELHIWPNHDNDTSKFHENCNGPMSLATFRNETDDTRQFILGIVCNDPNGKPQRMGTIDIGAFDEISRHFIGLGPSQKKDYCWEFICGFIIE